MRMSSFFVAAALLAVLVATTTWALDDDFAFDVADDFEVEIDSEARKLWSNKEFTANVGKAFHLVIPKEPFGKDAQSYEAKRPGAKPLPLWLLFDKIGGVFWGVPLPEDIGTLHLVIRAIGGSDKNHSEEIVVNVIEPPSDAKSTEKCPTTEDNTVLTLLIDRGVKAIKPKQRVIAINNIAKFFGLSISAFTLKPQLEKDDITDSSVVLAGPGNLRTRSSKLTSHIEVPVGCDGRLWMQTTSLVHQLKQQARDGTIAEVLGLPLIGWRVKTETRPVLRTKRQIADYGSGDNDEDYYYDNYDTEEYEDELGPGESETTIKTSTATSSTPTTITSTSSTTTTLSPTHPHRHHHGESINTEQNQFSPVMREHHYQSTGVIEPGTEPTPTTSAESSTTSTTSTTTTTTTTTTETPTTKEEIKTTVTALHPSTSTTSKSTTAKVQFNAEVNYDDDEYEFYDSEDDDNEDPIESVTIVPNQNSPKPTIQQTTTQKEPSTTTTLRTTVKEVLVETAPSTTVVESETTPIVIDDLEPPLVVYTNAITEASTTTSTTTEAVPTTIPIIPSTNPTTTTTTTTVATSPITTTTAVPVIPTTVENTTTEEEAEETTVKSTTVRHVMSTPRTTTIREITESLEYEIKNFPPYIDNRLPQMSVTAGKIFRVVVPKNTFNDMEDGRNLTLEFLNSKGEPVASDSWCHFNPVRREIYGLPLEEDVSKWEYMLRATDREGASVAERFNIQVQQHKAQRVVNHEFSLQIRIEKQQEFPHFVDWCLKVLRALGRTYNTNMSEITVRNVNYTSEPALFTWTNDSIATNYCPDKEIEQLFNILTANDRGDPARELNQYLGPELRVKKVLNRLLGVCEKPQPPQAVTPPTNFSPFLRNPVDHINATVGELLVFKVPEDTFYDPEDTDSRTLNISLLTGDRQPIKPSNWLQFDSKNREFYGIPRKAMRGEYQLICVDSVGQFATDSLEVVVYDSPKIPYNVEFSMTLETPFDAFIKSAALQRKFVEKLQEVFGDRNASFIHLKPYKQKHDSTIVEWTNKSLSTVKCPRDEISRLESVMKNNDRSISSRIHKIMDPDFPVSTIKVVPLGNCKVKQQIPAPPPEDPAVPVDEKTPDSYSDKYVYLMTYIVPASIVAVMMLLAAVTACILYRRRRTGKMSVEEDGRQSYGNKGIPVIFQEELEEKPEPGTKTPVILKDEKPPLAPPEYSKSGSLKLNDDSEPYQPPPPFTRTQDNGRQPRPKPTPTYRKPPPYVPP